MSITEPLTVAVVWRPEIRVMPESEYVVPQEGDMVIYGRLQIAPEVLNVSGPDVLARVLGAEGTGLLTDLGRFVAGRRTENWVGGWVDYPAIVRDAIADAVRAYLMDVR